MIKRDDAENKGITKPIKRFSKLLTPAEKLETIWPLLESDYERELIKKTVSCVEFKRGASVFHNGENISVLHYLYKGKVKMYRKGIGGRLYITRMIKPGEFFGIRPFFANQTTQTTAEVCESSEVIVIPVNIIDQILEKNIAVAKYFLVSLAKELGQAEDRIISLTQKHVRGRLAESLLFLMQNYGLENDGATLDIYLSREDLASLSNMTTSNAIRTLSSFASERIVALDGRKIKIIDPDELEKISRQG